MNEIIEKQKIKIEDMIYEIRGKQVMLDSDLARLYEVETKQLNRQVKRNIERFDDDFMFQLTDLEYQNLKCQIGTSSSNNYGCRRTLPYVFTEMGVTTLASVLHSTIAINMSKKIIRAFVMMRHYTSSNLIEQKYINNLVLEDHEKIKTLETSFDKLESKRKYTGIYFNGQIFDAYSNVLNIFSKTRRNLVIIDSYADNTVLDIVKRLNVKVILITKKNNLLTKQDIDRYSKQYNNLTIIYDNTYHDRYSKQYNNLTIIYDNTYHDRYFILDNKTVYHCGTSINRIGYKTFCINLISDEDVINLLLNKIGEIINE